MFKENSTTDEKLLQAKDYCLNDRVFRLTAEGYYMANTKSDGNVYFLKNEKTGYTKVGCSRNLEQRIRSFSTTIDKKDLTLLAVLPVPTFFMRELEKEVHETFESKRVFGEWFNLSNEDIKLFTDDFYDESAYFNYFNINELVESDINQKFSFGLELLQLVLFNGVKSFDSEYTKSQEESIKQSKLMKILDWIIEIQQWARDSSYSLIINGQLVLQW